MSVRHATWDDIGACLDVFEKASRLSGYYDEFDREIAHKHLQLRIFNPYSLVLINRRQDGVLVAAAAESTHTTRIKIGNEFLFADTDGLSLVLGFLRWARQWQSPEINFCTSFGGEDGQRAEALMERLGATVIGKQYRWF